jgi:hypothetical protein
MSLVGKWVELKTRILSKISCSQKDRYHEFSLICEIRNQPTNQRHESIKGSIREEEGDIRKGSVGKRAY